MAAYDEFGSGGIHAAGCATVVKSIARFVGFKVNDIAFVKRDAQIKGKLTKIAVKKIVVDSRKWVDPKIIDTTNRLWFEYELVNHSTAIALATEYHEFLAASIETEIDKLSCQ